MLTSERNQSGFAILGVLAIVIVVLVISGGGWLVYNAQKKPAKPATTTTTNATNTPTPPTPQPQQSATDPTANWKQVDSIGGAYSIKVPDGWGLNVYPNNIIMGNDITYSEGKPAVISPASAPYAGDQKKFTISFTDTRSKENSPPQWQSPNPYGAEATEEFSIGNIKGKRYSIEFTQTVTGVTKGDKIYQYDFALPNDKGLGVVYMQNAGDPDNLKVVEQAIKTIIMR